MPNEPIVMVSRLVKFFGRMKAEWLTPEQEHQAIQEFTASLSSDPIPSPFLSVRLEGTDKATVQFPVLGMAKLSDDGMRVVHPRFVPVCRTLTLFGGRVYVVNTTSRQRREQGEKQLHYGYMFDRPSHIPLERIMVAVEWGQAVERIGDHRDLRASNWRIVGRGTRDSKGRTEAVGEALRLYDEAWVLRHYATGQSLDISRADYEALLWFSLDYLDNGPSQRGAASVRLAQPRVVNLAASAKHVALSE